MTKDFDWERYPQDGGLGPQYHAFEDTFSIADLFHIEVFKISFEESRESIATNVVNRENANCAVGKHERNTLLKLI